MEEGRTTFAKQPPKIRKSPYLWSSIVFALSSVVSTGMAIETCVVDGWTSSSIGDLVSSVLYLGAYVAYVHAECVTPSSQPSGGLLSSPMIQRL
jgi:hypothetical protein